MTVQVEVVTSPSVIIVEIDSVREVVVDSAPDVALELTMPGIQGPPGPPGPQGPPGPTGAARELHYDVAIPAAVWEVTHDIVITPNVITYDSSGAPVEGDVTYPTPTTVRIAWAFPMAGHIVLTT
ncbi:hypothetical protein ACFFMN_23620 [Planobispora siamensis]|uniref:Collagen triple helix repeat-containing protein n=1 Tax=Planobispora siamensis TaxID=936338 RepID=A0A8J3SLB4_9ACTN|nr:hypothetical protein [Planobispora siamensis]GIH95354.1 hypothetical protein Psi01_59840 [Planobispora siamensis]